MYWLRLQRHSSSIIHCHSWQGQERGRRRRSRPCPLLIRLLQRLQQQRVRKLCIFLACLLPCQATAAAAQRVAALACWAACHLARGVHAQPQGPDIGHVLYAGGISI